MLKHCVNLFHARHPPFFFCQYSSKKSKRFGGISKNLRLLHFGNLISNTTAPFSSLLMLSRHFSRSEGILQQHGDRHNANSTGYRGDS